MVKFGFVRRASTNGILEWWSCRNNDIFHHKFKHVAKVWKFDTYFAILSQEGTLYVNGTRFLKCAGAWGTDNIIIIHSEQGNLNAWFKERLWDIGPEKEMLTTLLNGISSLKSTSVYIFLHGEHTKEVCIFNLVVPDFIIRIPNVQRMALNAHYWTGILRDGNSITWSFDSDDLIITDVTDGSIDLYSDQLNTFILKRNGDVVRQSRTLQFAQTLCWSTDPILSAHIENNERILLGFPRYQYPCAVVCSDVDTIFSSTMFKLKCGSLATWASPKSTPLNK